MSVPVSKRSEGKLTAIVKANKLASYTIHICSNEKNFPKRYRWCLTNKIVDSAIEINTNCMQANALNLGDPNEANIRSEYQSKALAASMSLLSLIDIAYNTFNISSDKIEYWTGLVIEAQNYIRSWRRSDCQRLDALKNEG